MRGVKPFFHVDQCNAGARRWCEVLGFPISSVSFEERSAPTVFGANLIQDIFM